MRYGRRLWQALAHIHYLVESLHTFNIDILTRFEVIYLTIVEIKVILFATITIAQAALFYISNF